LDLAHRQLRVVKLARLFYFLFVDGTWKDLRIGADQKPPSQFFARFLDSFLELSGEKKICSQAPKGLFGFFLEKKGGGSILPKNRFLSISKTPIGLLREFLKNRKIRLLKKM